MFITKTTFPGGKVRPRRDTDRSTTSSAEVKNTRVGTLIVATIYLQLIQNRYMF